LREESTRTERSPAEAIDHAGERAQRRGEIRGQDPAQQRDRGQDQDVVSKIGREVEIVLQDGEEAVFAVGGPVHNHRPFLEAFRRSGVGARHRE
jgi:hypothetical protein